MADGTGEPNPEGIDYYNSLIDALLEKGHSIEKPYKSSFLFSVFCFHFHYDELFSKPVFTKTFINNQFCGEENREDVSNYRKLVVVFLDREIIKKTFKQILKSFLQKLLFFNKLQFVPLHFYVKLTLYRLLRIVELC